MKCTLERRSEILRLLQQNISLKVENLAQQLKVSSVTIRNDLNYLEQQGLVVRSHGFAMLKSHLAVELPIIDKRNNHPDLKQRIGKVAASLLQEGDRVIFDAGTTTKAIVNYIGERQLTVLTNALDIAMELVNCPNVEVRMTGGVLRKNSMSFSGVAADNCLRQNLFNKLFLGVDGFDLQKGITTFNEQEAQLNRLMCEAAGQVIVVADSSKFGQHSDFIICPATQIDVLITDDKIPPLYLRTLEETGVKVLIA